MNVKPNENTSIIILCTIPKNTASDTFSFFIAKTLITKKLAACVTILPEVYSIYHWEGNLEETKETQLLIKTNQKLEKFVFQYIKNKHPYQTPELITLKIINGEPKYLSWINKTLNFS